MADLLGICYSAVFILIISFYLQNKLYGMEKHVPLPQWRMLRPVRKRFTTAHADRLFGALAVRCWTDAGLMLSPDPEGEAIST